MTEMVGLIACSKSKRGEDEQSREFRAEDLYDSWLFDGRVQAVKAHCEEWAIFSAKHGYVEPDDRLTWYDKRITELAPEERRELAAEVVDELPKMDRLMVLMGRDYAEPLKAVLPEDIEVWDPLEGVQLFDQRGELRDLASATEQATLMTDSGQSTDGTERAGREAQIQTLAPICQITRVADSGTMRLLEPVLIEVHGRDVFSSAWSRAEANARDDRARSSTAIEQGGDSA